MAGPAPAGRAAPEPDRGADSGAPRPWPRCTGTARRRCRRPASPAPWRCRRRIRTATSGPGTNRRPHRPWTFASRRPRTRTARRGRPRAPEPGVDPTSRLSPGLPEHRSPAPAAKRGTAHQVAAQAAWTYCWAWCPRSARGSAAPIPTARRIGSGTGAGNDQPGGPAWVSGRGPARWSRPRGPIGPEPGRRQGERRAGTGIEPALIRCAEAEAEVRSPGDGRPCRSVTADGALLAIAKRCTSTIPCQSLHCEDG